MAISTSSAPSKVAKCNTNRNQIPPKKMGNNRPEGGLGYQRKQEFQRVSGGVFVHLSQWTLFLSILYSLSLVSVALIPIYIILKFSLIYLFLILLVLSMFVFLIRFFSCFYTFFPSCFSFFLFVFIPSQLLLGFVFYFTFPYLLLMLTFVLFCP